jgi:hypothetical protein
MSNRVAALFCARLASASADSADASPAFEVPPAPHPFYFPRTVLLQLDYRKLVVYGDAFDVEIVDYH